jgi:OmpA-OmpF porin, OOP family
MPVLLIGAVLALILTLQPAARETVVLLPGPDGKVGTVIVQHGAERQVLNEAYATSRVRADGKLDSAVLSEREVGSQFGGTLGALPGRPARFLLYFVLGTDELTGESKIELENVLAEIKKRPIPDIAVIGHTDTIGDMDNNDRLSAQRAEAVKGFLVGIGVPVERIQTSGRGERELLVPTANEVEEPKNRRVEINVR